MKKIVFIILLIALISKSIFSAKNHIYFEVENLREENSIILVIDPKDGQIIDYSKGAKKFYGYENLNKINISDINLLTPQEVRVEMDNASKGKKNYFYFKHKLANGDIRDVYVSSYRMFCEHGIVLVSTVRDATKEIKLKRNSNILKYSIITILFIAILFSRWLLVKVSNEQKRYQELFDNMLEGFALHEMIFDKDGKALDYRFINVNPYFEKLTGLKKESLINKTVKEVLPSTENYWINAYGKVTTTGEPLYFENYSQELDKHFSCYAFSPSKNKFAVVFSDVTKEKKLHKELEIEKEKLQSEKEKAEILAVHDSLTNLPNRRLLQDRVETSILFAKRNKTKLAICVLDLDNFKQVNDKYGHLIGDEVLKLIAIRSKNSLREYDTISRIGGDEFVILITNFSTYDQCRHIVERLIEANRKTMNIEEHELSPTFSIGVAIYPEHGITYKELVKNADTALYEAKDEGKNRCIFFDTDKF